jgi:hypothetical protein
MLWVIAKAAWTAEHVQPASGINHHRRPTLKRCNLRSKWRTERSVLSHTDELLILWTIVVCYLVVAPRPTSGHSHAPPRFFAASVSAMFLIMFSEMT